MKMTENKEEETRTDTKENEDSRNAGKNSVSNREGGKENNLHPNHDAENETENSSTEENSENGNNSESDNSSVTRAETRDQVLTLNSPIVLPRCKFWTTGRTRTVPPPDPLTTNLLKPKYSDVPDTQSQTTPSSAPRYSSMSNLRSSEFSCANQESPNSEIAAGDHAPPTTGKQHYPPNHSTDKPSGRYTVPKRYQRTRSFDDSYLDRSPPLPPILPPKFPPGYSSGWSLNQGTLKPVGVDGFTDPFGIGSLESPNFNKFAMTNSSHYSRYKGNKWKVGMVLGVLIIIIAVLIAMGVAVYSQVKTQNSVIKLVRQYRGYFLVTGGQLMDFSAPLLNKNSPEFAAKAALFEKKLDGIFDLSGLNSIYEGSEVTAFGFKVAVPAMEVQFNIKTKVNVNLQVTDLLAVLDDGIRRNVGNLFDDVQIEVHSLTLENRKLPSAPL